MVALCLCWKCFCWYSLHFFNLENDKGKRASGSMGMSRTWAKWDQGALMMMIVDYWPLDGSLTNGDRRFILINAEACSEINYRPWSSTCLLKILLWQNCESPHAWVETTPLWHWLFWIFNKHTSRKRSPFVFWSMIRSRLSHRVCAFFFVISSLSLSLSLWRCDVRMCM